MSSVKIQGNASGTGILTIAAPNTNTDRTLTLPDEAGTILTNANGLSYEEGTWTPILSGWGASSVLGHYVKVGNQVTAYFAITCNSSGTMSITNAPFGNVLTYATYGIAREGSSTGEAYTIQISDKLTNNGQTLFIRNYANNPNALSGWVMEGTITYKVA